MLPLKLSKKKKKNKITALYALCDKFKKTFKNYKFYFSKKPDRKEFQHRTVL